MTLAGQILAVGLVLLDVLPPSPSTTGSGSEVYPQAGHGFAAYLSAGSSGSG